MAPALHLYKWQKLEVKGGSGPKVHCWRARVRYSCNIGVVDLFGI